MKMMYPFPKVYARVVYLLPFYLISTEMQFLRGNFLRGSFLKYTENGIKVNCDINNLRYTDETSKCLSISRKNVYNNLTLRSDGNQIKRGNKFKYLGRSIEDECADSMEIKYRIEMARADFCKYSSVLRNYDFNLNLLIL